MPPRPFDRRLVRLMCVGAALLGGCFSHKPAASGGAGAQRASTTRAVSVGITPGLALLDAVTELPDALDELSARTGRMAQILADPGEARVLQALDLWTTPLHNGVLLPSPMGTVRIQVRTVAERPRSAEGPGTEASGAENAAEWIGVYTSPRGQLVLCTDGSFRVDRLRVGVSAGPFEVHAGKLTLESHTNLAERPMWRVGEPGSSVRALRDIEGITWVPVQPATEPVSSGPDEE